MSGLCCSAVASSSSSDRLPCPSFSALALSGAGCWPNDQPVTRTSASSTALVNARIRLLLLTGHLQRHQEPGILVRPDGQVGRGGAVQRLAVTAQGTLHIVALEVAVAGPAVEFHALRAFLAEGPALDRRGRIA